MWGRAPVDAGFRGLFATCDVTQGSLRSETNSAASYPLSTPSVSRRVDLGRWRCTNVQGGPPLDMAVGLREVALNNQTVPVLHQRMAYEVQCRPGGMLFL